MLLRMLPLFLLLLGLFPSSLLGQAAALSLGFGYGISQSRLRSGDATSLEAGARLARWGRLEVHSELLFQWGTFGGSGCERLGARYCIGGTDRNQILGVGTALHLPLGSLGPIDAFVPFGVGIYHRNTSSTETEGPIELCLEGDQLVSCPGNPPFRSVSYRTRATVPGYSVGIALRARAGGFGLHAGMRVHDLLEQESKAGALPFSVGIHF